MRKAMLAAMVCGLGLVDTVLAKAPPSSLTTQRSPNIVVEFFKSLDWYIWLLVVALLALVVVFFYLRKRQNDD